MNDLKVLRWTGAFGVAAGVLLLVASPLYVVMGTPPSLGDAAKFSDYVTRSNTIGITTKLVDMVYIVGFIVFVAGLRHLIRRVRPDYEWLSALVFGSALVGTASVLIFEALAGRAALDTFNKPDPTVVRALTEASLAITAFGFILTALFLAAVSYAILATRALPRWTGWVGSRDLRGERLHGSRGRRGDHLRRLIRVRQRHHGARIHWVAPYRRHLDDAREAGGHGADAGPSGLSQRSGEAAARASRGVSGRPNDGARVRLLGSWHGKRTRLFADIWRD
jgi:hypothetical protein